MAPKLPKKLASAKKSLSRDTSSSGNNNNDDGDNNPSQPPSSASPMSKLQSKKFKKPSMPNIISTDGIMKRSSSLLERNVSSGSGTDYNNTPPRRDSQQQQSISGTGGRLTNKGTYSIQQPFEVSEGAMRLNRILDSNTGVGIRSGTVPTSSSKQSTSAIISSSRIKSIDGNIVRKSKNQANTPSSSLLNPTTSATTSLLQSTSTNTNNTSLKSDYIPPSTISLPDPTNEITVGLMTCRISSKMRIDIRSIGGQLVNSDGGKVDSGRTGNLLLKENWEEEIISSSHVDTTNSNSNGGNGKGGGVEEVKSGKEVPTKADMNRLTNECLFSMCVSQFDLSVGKFLPFCVCLWKVCVGVFYFRWPL